VSEGTEYGKRMPLDEDILEPLGRVMWAAIRLHHVVRDAINHIQGQPSDKPFDVPLGAAIAHLEKLATAKLAEPDRSRLLAWIENEGKPAARERNGVAHAISYTDPDGRQALRGTTPDRPSRYQSPELLEVVGVLAVASRRLPPAPLHAPVVEPGKLGGTRGAPVARSLNPPRPAMMAA